MPTLSSDSGAMDSGSIWITNYCNERTGPVAIPKNHGGIMKFSLQTATFIFPGSIRRHMWNPIVLFVLLFLASSAAHATAVINTATYGSTVWKHLEKSGAKFGQPIAQKAMRDAVLATIEELMPTRTNQPTGADVAKTTPHSGTATKALADIKKLYTGQGNGSISLTLVGEAHNNANDVQRGQDIIAAVGTGNPASTLMLYERYLNSGEVNPTTGNNGPYPWPGGAYAGRNVSELSLSYASGARFFGDQLNVEGRSALVAGYLVLTTAGGDQAQIDKVLIFFGAEHSDILEKYEQYAKLYAPWLLKRARTYFIIDSFAK